MTSERPRISRRGLFGAAGAAVATGVAGYAAHSVLAGEESQATDTNGPVEFHGEHQAGIVTPVQDRLHFAAFDVTTTKRDELVALLKEWTAAAALLTAGRVRYSRLGFGRTSSTSKAQATPRDLFGFKTARTI